MGQEGGGESQFKKGSDWWKFSIWNRVMGSQPIRIRLGKILWEMLQEILTGKSFRKFFQENLAGKSMLAIFGTFFSICKSLTGS